MSNRYGLADYPFESHFLSLPEGNIHYVDEGSGPVLLMLHGNPTWSFLYRHQIKNLRRNFRCIALDHLGMGLSDKSSQANYSIAAHSLRLGQFVEALNLKNITLLVHDWGGPIGLDWAAQNKDLVSRLVILNTIAFPPNRIYFKSQPIVKRITQLYTAAFIGSCKVPYMGEFHVQGLNSFIRGTLMSGVLHKKHFTKEDEQGYLYPYLSYKNRSMVLRFPRELPLTPLHHNWQLFREIETNLAGWQVPSLILWGMKDPLFPFACAETFAKLLPNTKKLVRYENASHFPQEDEADEISMEIESFIAKETTQRALYEWKTPILESPK